MSNVKIVTDSATTIDQEIIEKYDITVIPLSVMIDGVIYPDTDLTGPEYMKKMDEAKALPKTSQPAIGLFVDAYEKLAKDGSQIISIHITHYLSGTIEAARQAQKIAGVDVEVIDSGFTDQATAFQVELAAKMASEGKDVEEIIPAIDEVRDKTHLFVGISSLENLVKGGRVGRATGMISQLLNIKAVMTLTVEEGLQLITKGRGNKTFTKWLDELIQEIRNSNQLLKRIEISHADGLDIVLPMKAKIEEAFPGHEIIIRHTGSVIATHVGKGGFAVMYYTE